MSEFEDYLHMSLPVVRMLSLCSFLAHSDNG